MKVMLQAIIAGEGNIGVNNSILKTLAFLRLKISQSLGIPFVLPNPLGRTKGRVFSLLTTHCLCGTGFQPAVESTTIIRRQMLSHFPTVTQSTGFQPEPLLITHSSLFKLETLWNLLKRFSSFKGGGRGGYSIFATA